MICKDIGVTKLQGALSYEQRFNIYKQGPLTSIRCGSMSQVFCGHKM